MLLFVLQINYGQIDLKSSISSIGDNTSSTDINIIYTVGETYVQEIKTTDILLSEGFITADLKNVTGITNYGILSGLKVFPNPVKDILNVNFDKKQAYEIFVFDMNGKEIQHISTEITDKQSIDLSNQKTGVYLLIVVDRIHQKNNQFKIQKL